MSGIPAGAGSLIGKRLGKYEILALLALGGTAEIYLARIGGAAGFEKYVVVKCLHDHLADDADFVRMFLDEARMAAMLDHSNIVQTFELGGYENRYYMVMEFLAGLSLALVVRRAAERLRGGLLPVPLVLNIAAQACAGLHYAHERSAGGKPLNMVHRDISPQNLVVTFEGVVKVVDFGIARAELRETKTKAGTIKGKFAYMSPEQCVATNVDRRTDVFALGVIAHELLTGRRLFKRGSPYETYQAVIECAVQPPSRLNNQLDPAIDPIVMKALEKDRENRYPSAEAFGDAMLGYLHHRGKGSGGGEIGRFFEQHFAEELDEHSQRMRELIAGRDLAVDPGVGWDEGEERANQTVDLGGKQLGGAIVGEIMQMRSSNSSLDSLVGQLGDQDPDALPSDKTNIVQNPLEMIEQLDAQVARNSGINPVPHSTVTSGPAPLPAPPATRGPPAAASRDSGKLRDVPDRPTLVPDAHHSDRAPSAIGGNVVSPLALRHTEADMSAQSAPHGSGSSAPPQSPASAIANAPTNLNAPIINDYPVMRGGQRPFSADLAPSAPPSQPQRASAPSMPTTPLDPQQAANLVSPIGEQYPQTDWDRAAAASAKALPPWMLAALFGAALVGAMLLTLAIAKIFS
jgi:eukaryotic-like serine/threonine-protein kinase